MPLVFSLPTSHARLTRISSPQIWLFGAFGLLGSVGCGGGGEGGGEGGDGGDTVEALGGSFLVACDYPTGLNPATPVHSCVNHYAKETSSEVRDGLTTSCTAGGGTPRDDYCPEAERTGACLVQQAGTWDSFGLFSLQWMYAPTTTDEARNICQSGDEPFVRPDGTLEVKEEPELENPGPVDQYDDLDTLCPENAVPGPNLPGAMVVFTIETESGLRRIAGRVTGTNRDELEFRAQCFPLDKPGGYGISFSLSTRNSLEPGAYNKDTPDADEVIAVNGSYSLLVVAPYDSTDQAAAEAGEYDDAWQGTSFSASRTGFTEDYEFEITSISPLAETSTFFKVEAHGWAQIAMQPTFSSGEPDHARAPATLRVDF